VKALSSLALAVALAAPAAAGAAPRPVAGLRASPARLVLARSQRGEIRVENPGRTAVVVEVARAGFAFGPRGRPFALLTGVAAQRASSFLAVRPARLVLAPGAAARIAVAAAAPHGAAGDHPALVVLTARPAVARKVAVRLRIGVTIVVRDGGKLRRRLVVAGLHVRAAHAVRILRAAVVNDGNVVEHLGRGALTVALIAHGSVVARLRSPPRELLPEGTASFELPYRGPVRGTVTAALAVVEPGRAEVLRRRFRVTL
jgi:hypothetical protein